MLQRLILACLLAIPVLAGLQDLVNCDPLKKDKRCPPDPAFASKSSFDFNSAGWNDQLSQFWAVDSDTAKDSRRLDFKTNGKGAAFGLWGKGQAPTLTSNKYMLFGKVSVEVMAARGRGLVTAMVLKSDSGDEIDWELLGAYENQAQSNYFYDGEALFNTYNNTYHLDSSSYSAFHKYSIEWTDKILRFSIDDKEQKTWHIGEIPADKWPQTPMQVKLGIWAVAKDSDPGEIAWAGGVPDWNKGPYKAYFKALEVEDYTGMCNETEGSVEYQYNERTWGWQNIQVKGCKKRSIPGMQPPSFSSRPGQPTKTDDGLYSSPNPTDATSTDDATPTETSDGEGDEDAAPVARWVSSPLAAVVVLGWLLIW